MLKVGVQTKGILPDMPVDKGFQFIKDAGFEKVDLSIDTFLKNSDLYAGNVNRFFDASVEDLFVYFNDYRIAMEKAGISPSQMHAPYPVNVLGRGKQNEYMQGNVIPKNILIAEFLGVPWIVVHPFKMQYVYGKDVERAKNIEYFKMLIPLLKQCNVGICFENLYEGIGQRLVEGVCADPDDAIWYLDTLNDYAGLLSSIFFAFLQTFLKNLCGETFNFFTHFPWKTFHPQYLVAFLRLGHKAVSQTQVCLFYVL